MSKKQMTKIRIIKIEPINEEIRGYKPPKIDSKIDAKRAVTVLKNWPGGNEVIEELQKKGLKL